MGLEDALPLGHHGVHKDAVQASSLLALLPGPCRLKELRPIRSVLLTHVTKLDGIEMHGRGVDRERSRNRVRDVGRHRRSDFDSGVPKILRNLDALLEVDHLIDELVHLVSFNEVLTEIAHEVQHAASLVTVGPIASSRISRLNDQIVLARELRHYSSSSKIPLGTRKRNRMARMSWLERSNTTFPSTS